MAYEVTATRKRPATFSELEGQDFVVSTINNALNTERIAHAYLFSGPRGVGKTSAARILAKSLNCEKGQSDTPCGVCSNCISISKGNSLDVIEIDGASNTSVNDIRTIKEEVLFAPNSSKYKVYIIDEVHMLSNSAFNALLKTIEEPPPYIVFIFATTEIQKVPATIRSRCQQFNFRLISVEKIKEILIKTSEELELDAEEDALFWIAKEATGSLRDAYTLFDQVVSFSGDKITMEKIRDKLGIAGIDSVNRIAEEMAGGNTQKVLELTDEALMGGVSIDQLIIDFTGYFRSILFLKHNIVKEALLGSNPSAFSNKVVSTYSISQVEQAIELLFKLYKDIRFSLNQRFELELVFSRLSTLSTYISPNEILKKIESIKTDLKSGAFSVQQNTVESEIEKKPSEDLSADTISSIIQSLRKNKLALSSTLEKAISWKLVGETLKLTFDSTYSGNAVKGDILPVKEKVSEILNMNINIEVSVVSPSGESSNEVDESIELVKRVFRGEVVNGDK
ncbi:MAG: DNA polymerase III subunit gamma/tau [Spirochaetes bacterium]|nr:MAG: DNA polymerase III subunit gamma/tau [Spirochaetota bacterium]